MTLFRSCERILSYADESAAATRYERSYWYAVSWKACLNIRVFSGIYKNCLSPNMADIVAKSWRNKKELLTSCLIERSYRKCCHLSTTKCDITILLAVPSWPNHLPFWSFYAQISPDKQYARDEIGAKTRKIILKYNHVSHSSALPGTAVCTDCLSSVTCKIIQT